LHYLMGGFRLVIRAGEVAVYWAVTPHRITFCQPRSRLGVMHVPLTEFLRWNLPAGLRAAVLNGNALTRRSQNARLDKALFKRWAADLQRSLMPATNPEPIAHHRAVMLELEAFLHRFSRLEDASDAAEPASRDHNKAEALARLIAERHTEPLTAEALAHQLGIHPNYAMTLFRRTFGLTIHEFLTQHRVAHAQRLLITTDLSVLDVALESGFQSLSRFYAVFNQASGVSPSAYRQRNT
jgi:AraC-like DNA-binding protein